MNWLKRIYYRVFPHYRRLESGLFDYATANKMIRGNEGKPDSECWVIANEEDHNTSRAIVFLERRERIL